MTAIRRVGEGGRRRRLCGWCTVNDLAQRHPYSLHLRAALGTRPQVAAAQAALGGVLPLGGERQTLLELARVTAVELDLTGLRGALATE